MRRALRVRVRVRVLRFRVRVLGFWVLGTRALGL